jgi:hydroxymethylpyrimidine pyrophosphatase-like HAD family hydrolase
MQPENIHQILEDIGSQDAVRNMIPYIMQAQREKYKTHKKANYEQQKEKNKNRKQLAEQRNAPRKRRADMRSQQVDEVVKYVQLRLETTKKTLEVSLVEIAFFCHLAWRICVNVMHQAVDKLARILQKKDCTYDAYHRKIIVS